MDAHDSTIQELEREVDQAVKSLVLIFGNNTENTFKVDGKINFEAVRQMHLEVKRQEKERLKKAKPASDPTE